MSDFTEHPYYKHVHNCEHCSGPHGHCAEGLRLKNTSVVTDFTEQARREIDDRLLEDLAAGFIPSNELKAFKLQAYLCLEARFRSFAEHVAAEAATQGQQVGIERAIKVCTDFYERWRQMRDAVSSVDKQSWNRFSHIKNAAHEICSALERLNPDANYLNRVRNEARKEILAESTTWNTLDKRTREQIANEAATAALEQERKRVEKILMSMPYDPHKFGMVAMKDVLAVIEPKERE